MQAAPPPAARTHARAALSSSAPMHALSLSLTFARPGRRTRASPVLRWSSFSPTRTARSHQRAGTLTLTLTLALSLALTLTLTLTLTLSLTLTLIRRAHQRAGAAPDGRGQALRPVRRAQQRAGHA